MRSAILMPRSSGAGPRRAIGRAAERDHVGVPGQGRAGVPSSRVACRSRCASRTAEGEVPRAGGAARGDARGRRARPRNLYERGRAESRRRVGEGHPRLGRARRGEARADRGAAREAASRTAWSSCATASSRASGTSAAPARTTTQNVFSATKSVAEHARRHRPGRRRPAHRRRARRVDPAVAGHAGRRPSRSAIC